jgi:hypothetical protein
MTNRSIAHHRDPLDDAYDAQREADRWRMAARLALTEAGRQKAQEHAEHYQACADRRFAEAKGGRG